MQLFFCAVFSRYVARCVSWSLLHSYIRAWRCLWCLCGPCGGLSAAVAVIGCGGGVSELNGYRYIIKVYKKITLYGRLYGCMAPFI